MLLGHRHERRGGEALAHRAAVAQGRDLINLGQGTPEQPTPPHIVQALQEAVENPATHKYSPFRGLGELTEAAATFYNRAYNVDIDPLTEVAILFGLSN